MKPSEPTTPNDSAELISEAMEAVRLDACGSRKMNHLRVMDLLHDAREEIYRQRIEERAPQSESERRIELEEGFRYWTHEGHIARFNQATETTELLGPGGWTPAL